MQKTAFVISLLTFLALVVVSGCSSGNSKKETIPHKTPGKAADQALQKILESRKLVASTDYNSTNYFIYRGELMGYQYELLKSFSKFLNVKLQIQIINDVDESIECLEGDRCDVVAAGLTVTRERSTRVDFTESLFQTRQVLVQRKPKNWRLMATADQINRFLIRNPIELAGKTIHIQKQTSFRERLANLSDEIGTDIHIVEHPDASVEELIEMVNSGEIDFTISDEHIAIVNQKYYPDIDVGTHISYLQNIAWAVKKGAHTLLDTMNVWLEQFTKSPESVFIYNKYFKNSRTTNIVRSEYLSSAGSKISPYDSLIRKYSETIGWDWRLLASLIHQESKFDPNARSPWSGAIGLMQLMPHNTEKYGIDSLSSPEEQIHAGVQYIKLLDKQFKNKIPDNRERIKFVLASYNVGIAHVYDARRLAEKHNKSPNLWDDNVDYYLLNKSKPQYYNDPVVRYGYCRGIEAYNFVYDILDRYEHYRNIAGD
jgi:membrane-bound lytic murein transglycosylase F